MKNKFRTEAFDRMQYFYTTAHDPVIRARLRLAGRIEEKSLRRAVDLSAQAVPQVRLCFDRERRGWAPGLFLRRDGENGGGGKRRRKHGVESAAFDD